MSPVMIVVTRLRLGTINTILRATWGTTTKRYPDAWCAYVTSRHEWRLFAEKGKSPGDA